MPSAELELLVWVRTGWKDPRLAWDPKNYGGIDQLVFSSRLTDAAEDGDIWMPDLDLYNTPTSLHSLPNKNVMLWLVYTYTTTPSNNNTTTHRHPCNHLYTHTYR